MSGIRTKLAIRDQMHTTLTRIQQQRHLRQEVDADGQPGWVGFEIGVMWDQTNALRAGAGLPEIPLAAFEAIERQAVGHSDYTAKLALYCAELAVGEGRSVW